MRAPHPCGLALIPVLALISCSANAADEIMMRLRNRIMISSL
jgi:hypothetical protein